MYRPCRSYRPFKHGSMLRGKASCTVTRLPAAWRWGPCEEWGGCALGTTAANGGQWRHRHKITSLTEGESCLGKKKPGGGEIALAWLSWYSEFGAEGLYPGARCKRPTTNVGPGLPLLLPLPACRPLGGRCIWWRGASTLQSVATRAASWMPQVPPAAVGRVCRRAARAGPQCGRRTKDRISAWQSRRD